MFLTGDRVVWSASDLAAAAECEFGVARRLDAKLGRITPASTSADPLMERIATLGDAHEQRLLQRYAADGAVASVERLTGAHTQERLIELAQTSLTQFAAGIVVYQPGFFDGEFFGYADFVEPSPEGWVVADAKLARSAKPKAMLQVAAYADQLARAGLLVAPHAALLLGDGRREDVPLRDILPVFRARRERLRAIIAERLAAQGPVEWGDESHTICGSCPECSAAIDEHADLLLVAGLRRDQRRKLREAGIRTIRELAATSECPSEVNPDTFTRLRTQAIAQVGQLDSGQVSYRPSEHPPTDPPVTLPAPSAGDIFFDFEGDPLYTEDDPAHAGLEYLWGLRLAMDQPGVEEEFRPLWAHDYGQERAALTEFMTIVTERLARHPDLHIYHYAPYEVTALKRLAGKYGLFEAELDELLRQQVFVDLYAIVRRAVVVSQPSYSIKKLEPLYMGDELRSGDVQKGDVSIAEYHLFRLDQEATTASRPNGCATGCWRRCTSRPRPGPTRLLTRPSHPPPRRSSRSELGSPRNSPHARRRPLTPTSDGPGVCCPLQWAITGARTCPSGGTTSTGSRRTSTSGARTGTSSSLRTERSSARGGWPAANANRGARCA